MLRPSRETQDIMYYIPTYLASCTQNVKLDKNTVPRWALANNLSRLAASMHAPTPIKPSQHAASGISHRRQVVHIANRKSPLFLRDPSHELLRVKKIPCVAHAAPCLRSMLRPLPKEHRPGKQPSPQLALTIACTASTASFPHLQSISSSLVSVSVSVWSVALAF